MAIPSGAWFCASMVCRPIADPSTDSCPRWSLTATTSSPWICVAGAEARSPHPAPTAGTAMSAICWRSRNRYGAESFDLIGHSMGGFIGMTLAAQQPQRCSRLVLIDALGVPEPSALRAHRAIRQPAGAHPPVDSGGAVADAEVGRDRSVECVLGQLLRMGARTGRRLRPDSDRPGSGHRGQRRRGEARCLRAVAAAALPCSARPGHHAAWYPAEVWWCRRPMPSGSPPRPATQP